MDSGPLDLTPTQGRIFHTITMTKKEPNLPPSGRSRTSCPLSFSCCTECMAKGSPSSLCHTVPKNSKRKVPNGCFKSAPPKKTKLNSLQNRAPKTIWLSLSASHTEGRLLSLVSSLIGLRRLRTGAVKPQALDLIGKGEVVLGSMLHSE